MCTKMVKKSTIKEISPFWGFGLFLSKILSSNFGIAFEAKRYIMSF